MRESTLTGWKWFVGVWASLSCVAVGTGALAGGRSEAIRAAAALALCGGMAAVSLGVAVWAIPKGPVWQMGAVLGGAGIRSVVSLGAGLGLYLSGLPFKSVGFLGWLAAAYLASLALEVACLLAEFRRLDGAAR